MDPNGLFIRHTGIEQKLCSANDVGYPGTYLVIFHADRFLTAGNSLVAFTIYPPLRRIRIAIGNDSIEWAPVKQIFWPGTPGKREPWRADKLADESESGVRRQEDVARCDWGDLFPHWE